MSTYAKVINGVIVEYPVYDIHIRNRGHRVDQYTLCVYDDRPVLEPYYNAVEVLEVSGDVVKVHYRPTPISLDVLLNRLPDKTNDLAILRPTPPAPDLLDRIRTLVAERVQKRLDDFAATRGYGDANTSPILSACSYLNDPDPQYASDAAYCINARSNTWATLYAYLDTALSGNDVYPRSWNDIESHLPTLAWPNQ